MGWFSCDHDWRVADRNYTPPVRIPGMEVSVSSSEMRTILEGRTHIYLRCHKCGDIQEKNVFGECKIPIEKATKEKP